MKHSYFNQSNINLHDQIFQGLAGIVVSVPQALTWMLDEASYSSQNTMGSPSLNCCSVSWRKQRQKLLVYHKDFSFSLY